MPAHLGDGSCIEATPDALHCHIWPDGRSGDGDYRTWLPRSIVDDDSEVQNQGEVGEIVVRTWFAQNEDLPFSPI